MLSNQSRYLSFCVNLHLSIIDVLLTWNSSDDQGTKDQLNSKYRRTNPFSMLWVTDYINRSPKHFTFVQ